MKNGYITRLDIVSHMYQAYIDTHNFIFTIFTLWKKMDETEAATLTYCVCWHVYDFFYFTTPCFQDHFNTSTYMNGNGWIISFTLESFYDVICTLISSIHLNVFNVIFILYSRVPIIFFQINNHWIEIEKFGNLLLRNW